MPYIPGALTDCSPAAAELELKLCVAFKGRGTDHIFLASTDDPADASSWRIVDVNTIAVSPRSPKGDPAQIRTSHSPALTSVNNYLWLTFKGHDNPNIWQVALRQPTAGEWELLRFGCLDHAQTALGPSTGGPAMEPGSVSGDLPDPPMVVYRGNRDDGVWIHSYTTRANRDLQLADAHTEFAPAVACRGFPFQEEYTIAYLDRDGRRVMYAQNHRVMPHAVQPPWPAPTPVPNCTVTARQPALGVRYDVLYLASNSSGVMRRRTGIYSWDNFWVDHGSMQTVESELGPALAGFGNTLYVICIPANNRIWYAESDASRRRARTTIVVTLGGASTGDFHGEVQKCALAFGYPLKVGANWAKDQGEWVSYGSDATRIKNRINTLASANGGNKPQLSLLLAGKSAGGVLAWNTFRHYFFTEFVHFDRAALVLVDAHGSVYEDGEVGPYSEHRNLWWPNNWSPNQMNFRVYNIRQFKDTLTGANFPDSHVYRKIRLTDPNVNHYNIIHHRLTHGMITDALRFAVTGE